MPYDSIIPGLYHPPAPGEPEDVFPDAEDTVEEDTVEDVPAEDGGDDGDDEG